MKIISIFLALINSLLAGLLISALVTRVDFHLSMPLWSAARILVALTIIAIGALSWIALILPTRPSLLILGSLFLVAIGPAMVVWTFHQASVTGRTEYYMLMYGASLFVQGISLLFGLFEGRDNIAAV